MKLKLVNGIILLAINANEPLTAQTSVNGTDSNQISSSIPCNSPHVFWGVDFVAHQLMEFELINNIVSLTGNTVDSCKGRSLAITNNLNNGSISPTFYTSEDDSAFYWDGNGSWIDAGTNSIASFLVNAGGSGNLLYYMCPTTAGTSIIQFDGQNFNLIADSLRYSACADIAVDAAGNFILIGMGTNYLTDSLFLFDGSGSLINKYPFVFDAHNMFGSFLMNGIYYIGLGNQNSNPNSLLPVSIIGGNAVAAPVIPLPPNGYYLYDLASCNPGLILGTPLENETEKISIYPTPANSLITISYQKLEGKSISIFDMEGKLVLQKNNITSNTVTLDVSGFENGIYIIEVSDSGFISRIKMCKQ